MLVAAIGPILPLLLLACPVGMGVMMWFMSRGMKRDRREQPGEVGESGMESLAELRALQARLAAKIDAAESEVAERAGTRA